MSATSATAAIAAGLALLATSACAGDDERATVTVLAAASLTDAFTDLARAFEHRHDDAEVRLSFGASSSLREQVLAGAPADVFASADPVDLEVLADAGAVVGRPQPFATNRLQLAVPAGNPGAVRGLGDLARDDLLVGLCASEVPCGRLAGEVLGRAGVTASVDTEASDVRSLLTQVASGDLDVGLVYGTDVAAAEDRVDGIAVPAGLNALARCPIAVLEGAADPDLAGAFVAFVRSDEARAVLADHGFGAP